MSGPLATVPCSGSSASWAFPDEACRFVPTPRTQRRDVGLAESRLTMKDAVLPQGHVALRRHVAGLVQQVGAIESVVLGPAREVELAACLFHVVPDEPRR